MDSLSQTDLQDNLGGQFEKGNVVVGLRVLVVRVEHRLRYIEVLGS